MRQERGAVVHPAVAPTALVLVLPAAIFFMAAALRQLQPVQHQPAAAADAYFRLFVQMSRSVKLAVLLLGPAAALVLAGIDQYLRWRRDPSWRSAVLGVAAACRPLIVRPLAIMSALALLVAAVWLAFVVVHAIAG
jgi:hypothetical protein